jgi:hypothetical protein
MAADAQNPGARRSGSDQSEGSGPAGDQARLQELSRKLLDLWQDHLSAVAQDPNLLAQTLKLMTAAPFAWMPGFQPASSSNQGGPGFAQPPNPFQPGIFGGPFAPPAAAAPSSKAGTAAAAAASAAGADDVEQLRRRLAELEGRLAQLESVQPKSGPKPSRAGGAGKAKPGTRKPRRGTAKG